MSLIFQKYSSIKYVDTQDFIDTIISEGLNQGDYIVQEKAHGANLSVWYDGNNIKYAKRTDFILNNNDFYDLENMINNSSNKIENIIKQILVEKNAHTVVIYGELIGGFYDHPDIKRDKTAVLIQKGVSYCPHNDFYGFDIKVDGKYLSIDEANMYFERFKLIYAKTIFKGNFTDCLKYPDEFASIIYQQFGLPEVSSNICEGIVIKPNHAKFTSQEDRIIIKSKNAKWAEKASEKKNPIKHKITTLSDQGNLLLQEILTYITENRLNNLISKKGKIRIQNFGEIIKDYNKDVLDDFLAKFEKQFDKLEMPEQKHLKISLNKHIVLLIKQFFAQQIKEL